MPNPIHVALIQQLNERFFVRKLDAEPAPALDAFAPMSENLARLGMNVPDSMVGFVDALPSAISASLIAVASVATTAGIPVTFGWIAGYDYELTVAQADRAEGSLITVIMRGPTPSDVAAAEAL